MIKFIKTTLLVLGLLTITFLHPYSWVEGGHRLFYQLTGFMNNDLTLVNPKVSLAQLSKGDVVLFHDEKIDQAVLYYVQDVGLETLSVKNTQTGVQYLIRKES